MAELFVRTLQDFLQGTVSFVASLGVVLLYLLADRPLYCPATGPAEFVKWSNVALSLYACDATL